MSLQFVNKINKIEWNKINQSKFPFLSYEFFQALEESHSIGKDSGWEPIYITDPGKSVIFSFIKNQSYGEYIFDWDWAKAYHANRIAYYPKLTSMIPFTSVTTPHFLGENSIKLMNSYEEYYQLNSFSSSHFLFLPEKDLSFFQSFDYLIRESFQYHFTNIGYVSFDSFLSDLKNKKAKQIRKERIFPANIKIYQISGDELTQEHADEMYLFYLSTIENKQAIPYLKQSFFNQIFLTLKDQICYIQAKKDEVAIAGALYFYDQNRLYGRYWGLTEEIPNLHFELCYYQGIEFCIKKGLSVFEAGAQGEHKISRGFRPVKTYSAHKFKHAQFHHAISNYIREEKSSITSLMSELSESLPFK